MCTQGKYVHNKYIHKSVFVSCGRCKSCQQQKANARALRIRNHNYGSLCAFVTLTYDNRFVPYVHTSDLLNIDNVEGREVQVFRDCSCRYYLSKKHIKNKHSVLASYSSFDFEKFCYSVPELRKKPECTGVIYWPDVQNFMKRLRIILKRKYNYEFKITYYAVGEYGSNSHRPHFHVLIYFEKGSLSDVRPAIIEAWPYGDMSKSDKRIQEAIDPSGYVASYVNKSDSLPKILESSPVRQKHSHSLYFGHSLDCFSLSSLLEKADRQTMYYSREVLKDDKPVLVDMPIPKYVINRYFPKFKGYSSFTSDEILQLLRFPVYLWDRLGRSSGKLIPDELSYTPEEFRRFVVHLRHCVDEYVRLTGRPSFQYADDYIKVWFERWNYVFKHSYDDIVCFSDFYENVNEFVDNPSFSLSLPDPVNNFYQCNPNLRKDIVEIDCNLVDLYVKKENIRKINSIALSSLYDDF